VVQTGVKFFGCENKIAQPSPIHSWKLMGPSVVSAEKSGATSLMRKLMFGWRLGASSLMGNSYFISGKILIKNRTARASWP